MMKLKSIVSIFFCVISFTTIAQRIKYKDLYPVLASKNYKEGIPTLRLYLADPKNAEEANAHLQMGLWLEEKFMYYDVVYDSSKVYLYGDSAISYLERAKTLITEKELKKRDEYYQEFFRRDLRTGEFGIKLSDVHLDIEKKVEAIKKRTADVKELNSTVSNLVKKQQEARTNYTDLTNQFAKYNTMLIAADDDIQSSLTQIEMNGREAIENANNAHEMAVKLDADKYTEELILKPIENFGTDGLDKTDLGQSIAMWDYETWARAAKSEIIGGIGLFKTMIKNFSDEIRTKKEKAKKSQEVEIGMFPSDLAVQFDKYDPESAVEKLLKIEMYEARVIENVDLQLNPALMDSALIGKQLEIYEEALENAKEMKVLAQSLTAEDLELAKGKYKDYIESFFQKYVTASKYLSDMKDWSNRQVGWLEKSVAYWSEKDRWGVDAEDEEFTYPLYLQDTPEDGKMTMGMPVKNPEEVVIQGVDMEAKKGYVVSFGADRVSKWKLAFDLPGTEAAQYEYDSLPTIAGSESFYIYNKAVSENNFVVVSYTPSGQLNWATLVTVSKEPVDYKFDDLTQELTILLYPEEDLPLDSDELGYIVIDRTGNAR